MNNHKKVSNLWEILTQIWLLFSAFTSGFKMSFENWSAFLCTKCKNNRDVEHRKTTFALDCSFHAYNLINFPSCNFFTWISKIKNNFCGTFLTSVLGGVNWLWCCLAFTLMSKYCWINVKFKWKWKAGNN